jgi:aquaporin Z
MLSACLFTVLLEHPALPAREAFVSPFARRLLIGLAMGLTAIALIYSPWGKRSGAHMNPAVTLAFLHLDRIALWDAIFYVVAQFTGGYLGVLLCQWVLPGYLDHPAVCYAVTMPGPNGAWVALCAEALLAFIILTAVLRISNHAQLAPYTGFFVGGCLVVFIAFEAPYSGMSINPARTVASALPARVWTGWWLYFVGPVLGMLLAGYWYRKQYRRQHGGDCTTMKCHLSGAAHDCPTYEVLGPKELLEKKNC